jgi:hypothetical protein
LRTCSPTGPALSWRRGAAAQKVSVLWYELREVAPEGGGRRAVSTDRISRSISAADRSPRRFWGRLREGSGLCPNLPPPPERVVRPGDYGRQVQRAGEAISTAFTESAVNQVISKRMVKKQQGRWTPRGAHLLLQVRTRVPNDHLADDFHHWYPGLSRTLDPIPLAA